MGNPGTDPKLLQDEIHQLKWLLKKREKELFSIQRIGKALSSTLNIDKLLRLIMQEITVLMGADRSTLYIVDSEKQELWAKVALKAEIKEIRQQIGRGISGTVAKTGQPINISDAYNDPRFDPITDKRTGYRTRSMLCMPVWDPNAQEGERKIIAVIQVLNKIDGVFTDEDEDLLEALASQVAISISNARLYQRVEKKLREIDLLHEFEQLLNVEHDLPLVYRKVLQRTVEHLNAEWVVAIVPDNGQLIVCSANQSGKSYQETLPPVTSLSTLPDVTDYQAMSAFWDEIRQHLSIAEIAQNAGDEYLFKNIQLTDASTGLLVAIAVGVGQAQDYQDERKIMELIAQKISRARELHDLRDGIIKRERLSAIGRVISTVVHDIRSPVSTINGFVDLMQDDTTTPDERNEFADIIRDEIRATMNMITEVLDFAKGKTNLLPRKNSAQQLVKRFGTRLKKMCEDNGTKLSILVESQQLLHVDEEKILRVFYNISKNALEAMGKGGQFMFRIYDENESVVFQFTDSGPGIPGEIQDRLFDSFVTSGKESGTGLGLAIVKKIIDEHNGRIVIDSKPESGATFWVKLPIYTRN